MISVAKLYLAAVAASTGFGVVHAQGGDRGFARSCVWQNVQLRNEDEMGTFCNNNNPNYYDYNYSTLPLRYCYANKQGQLVPKANGMFINSCHDCITQRNDDQKTATLTCTCATSEGKLYRTSVDLNDIIYNNDGRLICFGIGGTKERGEPDD